MTYLRQLRQDRAVFGRRDLLGTADLMGLHPDTLSRAERGAKPRLQTMLFIAGYYDLAAVDVAKAMDWIVTPRDWHAYFNKPVPTVGEAEYNAMHEAKQP